MAAKSLLIQFTRYDLRGAKWDADVGNSGNIICPSIERSDLLLFPYMTYMVFNLRNTIYDLRG